MNTIDGGTLTVPADTIDAGNSASPPADIIDSVYVLPAQTPGGATTPNFETVDTAHGIAPQADLLLYVKIGGTATTVTMQVPGVQPYTGADNDDVILAGLTDTERAFYVPGYLAGAADHVAVVTYSQTTGVSSALLKVG